MREASTVFSGYKEETSSSLTADNVVSVKAQQEYTDRNFGLDFLRASAILLVLVSHLGHQNFGVLGFWGVELFFALSGFLIGHILWKSYSGASKWTGAYILNFWSRRWWRTLPNYYLFLIIMLVFTYSQYEEIHSFYGLSKFIWFGQYILSLNWGFYSVSWSLCIEEWFYLLFPFILLIFNRLIANRKIVFALTILFFMISSITVRSILISKNPENYVRGITLARLDAIDYGVLLAFIASVFKISNRQKCLGFCIGALFQFITIVALISTGIEHIIRSQIFLIIVPLGFALMIPLVSMLAPKNQYSLLVVPVKKISLWSYSIYLSHMPLMSLAYFLLASYRDSLIGNFISKIVGFVLAIIVSALLFRYFELPLTKRRPAQK